MDAAMTPWIQHRVTWFGAVMAAAAVLLSGCTSDKLSDQSVSPVSSVCPTPMSNAGGDAVSPALGVEGNERYLYRCDKPPVDYRESSRTLANLVADIPGMGVKGLKSTADAAAVLLVEDDATVPWGTHVQDAERMIFQTFAKDDQMGDWLILVTDVVVHGVPDPIFPTAFRWTRQEIEDFVDCGIPETGSHNECSETWSLAADQIVLAPQGGPGRGR
jgi:hypothetical protein